MDLIEELEDTGRMTVIRPFKPVEVGRMEKDTSKLAALYQEGYDIALKSYQNRILVMNEINIRKAEKNEAGQIAKLFLLAWPVDEITESNGITYAKLLESITGICEMERTIYSYENTFVAEADGKVVGAMCGYDGAEYQVMKQPITDMLGSGSGFAELKETEAGEFYLDSVGVLPEYRNKGIASRLFEAQIERAKSLGHNIAGLIVDTDKPKAEALYSKLGFRHLDYKDFFGHKMKHMVRYI